VDSPKSIRADRDYEYNIGQFRLISQLATYHERGGNLLFIDGHVEYMVRSSLTRDHFDRRK